MATNLPIDQERHDVDVRLEDLLDAITQHPQWKNPPNQHPTLYHVWDFVMRSKYMLSEYENIKAGRPIQHPNQFPSGVGTGDEAALKTFQDVCGRTMMLQLLVNDTTGKTDLMTGNTGPPLNFGKRVKDAVKALMDVCPEEHFMAGLMN